MTNWENQPATKKQLGSIFYLLDLHRPGMVNLDELARLREKYKKDKGNDINTAIYLTNLKSYCAMPYELYEYTVDRIRQQIKDPSHVYLTKGKASEIMGEIRNGYTLSDFKRLFL